MPFLVCCSCRKVYAYGKGHCCPHSDGSQVEAINLSRDFSMTTGTMSNHRVHSTIDFRLQKRTKSTKSDFISSAVAPKPEDKKAGIECQNTHSDVTAVNLCVPDTCSAQYKQMQNVSQNAPVKRYQSIEDQETSDSLLRDAHQQDPVSSNRGCLPKRMAIPSAEQQALNAFPQQVSNDYNHNEIPLQMNKTTESLPLGMAFDNSGLVDIHSKFPNVQELHSHNLGNQVVGNLREKRIPNFEQVIASNISTSQDVGSEKAHSEISYSVASKEASVPSIHGIPTAPGPSGYSEKKRTSYLSGEKFQSTSPIEMQLIEHTDNETLLCLVCKKKIDEHVVEQEGKKIYACCICTYRSRRRKDLQVHFNIYNSNYTLCKICKKVFKENEFHDSEQTCNECRGKFQPKTLFELQYIAQTNKETYVCLVCKKNIDEHKVVYEGKTLYECCLCRHRSSKKMNLRLHMNSYGSRHFFCDKCERIVKVKEAHISEKICNICDDKFHCTFLFEQHHRVHSRRAQEVRKEKP